MISEEQVIPLVMESCPGFRPPRTRFSEPSVAESSSLYNDFTDLADYLVRAYGERRADELAAAFRLIERLLTEGDEAVRQATSVGLLEDVQNIASHEPFGYRVFEPWLGPQSKESWTRSEDTWSDKASLAGVLRAEGGQPPEPELIPDISKIENPELAKLFRATIAARRLQPTRVGPGGRYGSGAA